MQEYVIKKDNKRKEGNKCLVSVTKIGDSFSNKNSFEILGEIEEEVLDKMEEDAKNEKLVIHQIEDCGSADMGSNEIVNNKMLLSIKGEGEKKGYESAWNVRGLNKSVKQKEVIDVIRSNNLGICVVVESHVNVLNLKNVCVKTFGQWDWVSNNNSCEAGTRIIVGWNPRLFDVMMISQSKQVIHYYVKFCDSDGGMYLSFIYAALNYLERRLLWDNLKKHSLVVKKEAWGLLGDFNVALKPSEYSEGCSKTPKGVEDFVDCLSFIEVEDLNSYGFQFTWNKTPAGNMGLLKKLDRVMVNLKFISDHPLAHAVFKPYRNSDHCPAILNLPVDKVKWKPSFRFANFISEKEEFLPLVKEVWDNNIDGFFMFKVTQKLKILKKHCRELCNKHWGAGKRIQKLRKELECKQQEIYSNPFDCKIREEHANILLDFNVACNDEEKLHAQCAKIKWLQEGDNNSKFFLRIVKSRGNSNRIQMVLNEDGRWVSGKAMKDKFVSHFNKFLGCKEDTDLSGLNDDVFPKKLDSRVAVNMIRVVTDEEIKAAMFDIDDNRAPGPDGYSSKNFKSTWCIVGPEVCKAVREFFWTGKLLKGINATRLVLVPKVEVPRKVSDFRPIASCNTFYKCISKIIVNRIRNCLGDIVSNNQSAFIPGRSILDNILLAQELMVGYKKRGELLNGFGFHSVMVKWIMACVSSSWFMLNFNGEDHGIIRDALDEFKKVSGLKVSTEKSQIYFSCVKPNMRRIILGILLFDVGRFPFKYLGVPMCVTKLFERDCKKLIEKIKMRIFNWKSKTLSFAGRLQLINSVLTSIHVYWASIFKIPIATINEIEKMCRSFLWANGEIVKGKAEVKWQDICKPKEYGGLGIKNLRRWNDALLAKHVWNVINNKNSLWVQWVRINYIGSRNFWDILQKKSMRWTWKRFLEIRKTVRPHVVSCVGNGGNTALWHDWWHPIGILCTIIPRRDWVSNGLSDSSLVCVVLDFDTYSWPIEWVNKFPRLTEAPMFCIDSNMNDVVGWRDKKGICRKFSCKQVWSDLNNFGNIVPWHDIVWYNNCTPRNSFILWMAVLNRLKTQDRVRGWEVAEFGGISALSCVSHIWRERNSRLFGSRRISVEGVIASIENEIRLKLLGLRKRAKMVNNKKGIAMDGGGQ
ncbi:uncharacterized protein LOC111907126 [Lactuca sativa]|uniref:uncharacterized protein LOC111907126 n=1 Tax=Lactuca sativa TaxID=4236 RepID=UPI0022B04CD9|nr:uncharacterized protein LOC111907126 [Lactuca sativa]